MKISKYVFAFQDGQRTILFNAMTEKFIILEPELAQLYERNKFSVPNLQQLHPALYDKLEKERFIVQETLDESGRLIEEWKEDDDKKDSFGIIINPTLHCNMACWYCYEKHPVSSTMSPKVMESVFRLLDEKVQEKCLRSLNVSFFGGEPLLSFSTVVFPILKYASELSLKNRLNLYSNFTTNGVLLDDKVLTELNSLNMSILPTFQITFDGSRVFHNRTRHGKDYPQTYDLILDNVCRALAAGNQVFVRFNYTYENILSFLDVLDDFKTRKLLSYGHLVSISFEHVWQKQQKGEIVMPMLKQVRDEFELAGFQVKTDKIYHRHVCYADSPHHIVINYNGDIFKCTARDFETHKRDGYLTSQGQIVMNEQYHRRMHVRFHNKACRACRIMPICNGGCSQVKLENVITDACYRGMDENQKLEYVAERFQEIIKQAEQNTKGNIARTLK